MKTHYYGFKDNYPIERIKYYNDANLPSEKCKNCGKMLHIRGNAIMVVRVDKGINAWRYYHYYCSDKCMISDLL